MSFKEKFKNFDRQRQLGERIKNDFIDRLMFGWPKFFRENKKDLIKYLTPKWFEFLGWLFILSSLFYAYQKTESIFIFIIFILSLYFFFNFINYISDDVLQLLGQRIKTLFYFLIFYLIIGVMVCLVCLGLMDFITKIGFL